MKIAVMHPSMGELALQLPDGERVLIGRKDSGAAVEFNWDVRVSRKHAYLWKEDGQVWFEDLGSKNGSWYGQHQLEGRVRLEPGMSVLVGETIVSLKSAEEETGTTTIDSFNEAITLEAKSPLLDAKESA